MLAAGAPAAVAAVAALALGVAAGLPWTGLYVAAQRLRPDGPAAAIAVVNAAASLVILVGTPLVGLTFDELPGDGAIGFAAIAAVAAPRAPRLAGGCRPIPRLDPLAGVCSRA